MRDLRWQAGDPLEGARLMGDPVFQISSWRFRRDDGGEANATWFGTLNQPPTIALNSWPDPGVTFRLRLEIAEVAGVSGSRAFRLDRRINGGAWDSAAFAGVAQITQSAFHSAAHETSPFGWAPVQQRLGTGGGFVSGATRGDLDHGGWLSVPNGGSYTSTPVVDVSGGGRTEHEWTLRRFGQVQFQVGDLIEFRLVDTGTNLELWSAGGYPRFVVGAPPPTTAPTVSILDVGSSQVKLQWSDVPNSFGGYEIEVNGVSYAALPQGSLTLTHGDSASGFFRDFHDILDSEVLLLPEGTHAPGQATQSGLWRAWRAQASVAVSRTLTGSDDPALLSGRKMVLSSSIVWNWVSPGRDGESFLVGAGQSYRLRTRFWFEPSTHGYAAHGLIMGRAQPNDQGYSVVGLYGTGTSLGFETTGILNSGGNLHTLSTPMTTAGWAWLEYEYDAPNNRFRAGVGYNLGSLEWSDWRNYFALAANKPAYVGVGSILAARPGTFDTFAGAVGGHAPPTSPPVAPETYYVYRVRALGAQGETGPWSSPVDATTAPAGAPPPAPTLSLTGVGRRSVSLSWTLVGDGADWYHLYRGGVLVHGTEADNAAVLDLEPDTTYTFTVRAVNDFGESVDSNAIVVTTDAEEHHSGGGGASMVIASAGGGESEEPHAAGAGASITVGSSGGGELAAWVFDGLIPLGEVGEHLDTDVTEGQYYRYAIRSGTEFVWSDWEEWVYPEASGDPRKGAGTKVNITAAGGGTGAEHHASGSGTSMVASSAGSGAPGRSEGAGTQIGIASGGAGEATEHRASGAGATVPVAAAGQGAPGLEGGSSAGVVVLAAGRGTTTREGGEGSRVAVSTAGGYATAANGGAGASVAISASTGVQVSRASGAGAATTVTAAGSGDAARAAGSGTQVEARAEGSGEALERATGGASSRVAVTSAGEGATEREAGASASLEVTAIGGGFALEHRSAGAGSVLGVASQGAGSPAHSGASSTRTTVDAGGSGLTEREDGSSTRIQISTAGGSSTIVNGGAGTKVAIDASAGAQSSRSSGAGASTAATVAGSGASSREGGADTRVAASVAGGAEAGLRGGADARITVASAGGSAAGVSGGAGSSIDVVASGAPRSARASGSNAALEVAAAGSGTPHRAGGAGSALAVASDGGARTDVRAGAGARVAVSAAGGSESIVNGGAGTRVSIEAGVGYEAWRETGAGSSIEVVDGVGVSTARQGGAGSSMAATSAGAGAVAEGAAGGAGAKVAVATEGAGSPGARAGGGASVSIASAGSGASREERAGGAGATVAVAATGTPSASRSAGAGSGTISSAAGSGASARRAGTSTSVHVSSAGGYAGSINSGSGARLEVSSEGGGATERAGGAGATVAASSSGSAASSKQGGAPTYVAFDVAAGAEAGRRAGASVALIVTAEGAGLTFLNPQGGAGVSTRVQPGGGGAKAGNDGAGARVLVTVPGSRQLRTWGLFDDESYRPQRFDYLDGRPMPYDHLDGRPFPEGVAVRPERLDTIDRPGRHAVLARERMEHVSVRDRLFPMFIRPGRTARLDRQARFAASLFVRQEIPMELELVQFGPYTRNEIPEPLYVRVFERLRDGSSKEMTLHAQDPAWTARVSIKAPDAQAAETRLATIVNPSDLPTVEPNNFTQAEEGWVRVDWQEGDFSQAGVYSVQLTLDNGTVRLKSTAIYQPNIFEGPASDVVSA